MHIIKKLFLATEPPVSVPKPAHLNGAKLGIELNISGLIPRPSGAEKIKVPLPPKGCLRQKGDTLE